jgi:hypothetical protein
MSSEILEKSYFIDSLDYSNEAGFFRIRTANQCLDDAKTQPVPERLYYSLWFENELTILFADTGSGKSVYAVQIGEYISSKRKVLYLDLELSDKQFQNRYSENYQNEYKFNDNFYRINFKDRFTVPSGTSYEDYFIECLRKLIESTEARVVIIDNMTRLISGDTDKAGAAKPLMDRLNELKFDYKLSILCLEHTRKTDNYRPISLNDLQGSKMKANFADAAFTIGRSSKDKNLRYIKQLKCRSCEVEYDSENVLTCEMVKESNFLYFKMIESSNEAEHLIQITANDKAQKVSDVLELKNQGKSNVEIGEIYGVSEGCIRKWILKAESKK